MNLYDKHRHALEAFKERLLGSSLRDRIARIVVFGSFVKGVVREDSDLDILVVTNDGDELSDFIADVTLEVQMRHKIGIEPVVVSIDEFFPVRSYFLSNVMRHGWEIYSMPPERSQARYSSRALVGDQEAGAVMELAALLKELAEQELQ